MELQIYKMWPDSPEIKYGTQNSACFDLSACLRDTVKCWYGNNQQVIHLTQQDADGKRYIQCPPRARLLIPTGQIFDIPQGYSVRVYARSGLSTKTGLCLANSVGVIDSDYVEEVFVPIINNSDQMVPLYHGDRIAQAELVLDTRVEPVYILERPRRKTDREGGFGSTGVSTR